MESNKANFKFQNTIGDQVNLSNTLYLIVRVEGLALTVVGWNYTAANAVDVCEQFTRDNPKCAYSFIEVKPDITQVCEVSEVRWTVL
jgi:hypothetical protein